MGYLEHTYNQTVQKIPLAINAYGDYEYDYDSEPENIVCKFRNITDTMQATNREYQHSDALAWFAPDSGIVKGDVLICDDEYFRVRKVTKARTIDNPTVQFLKTELEKWKVVS